MTHWEYTQSFGRKFAKNMYRLSEEHGASKDTIHRQIKTLGNSYSSCRSVLHEMAPQQVQRRVDICQQVIGKPMDDRFIRVIVTCDEKCLYYRNPDSLKQWLGPCQPAKPIVKKSIRPQSNVACLVKIWRCESLRVCSKRACSRCGSLFSTTGTSS